MAYHNSSRISIRLLYRTVSQPVIIIVVISCDYIDRDTMVKHNNIVRQCDSIDNAIECLPARRSVGNNFDKIELISAAQNESKTNKVAN